MIKTFLSQMKEKFNLKMTLKEIEREAKLDELRYQVDRKKEKLIEKRESVDKGILDIDDLLKIKDDENSQLSLSEKQDKTLSEVMSLPLPILRKRWGNLSVPEPEQTLDDFMDTVQPQQSSSIQDMSTTFDSANQISYSTTSKYNDFIIRVFPQRQEVGRFYIDSLMNIVDADSDTILFNAENMAFDVLALKQMMNVSLSTGGIFYIMNVIYGSESKYGSGYRIEIHTNMKLDTSRCEQFIRLL